MRQTFRSVTASNPIPMRKQSDPFEMRHILRALAVVAIAALVAFAWGCAISALSSVRQKMASGQYAAAREELLAMPQDKLSPVERREVKDDLCVSEFML